MRADGLRIMRFAICALFAAQLASIVLFVVGFSLIQSGRKNSVQAVCAANSAVIDAGRSVITGHNKGEPAPRPSPKVERTYRKLGLPPFAVRQAQADARGRMYGLRIAAAVERQTGAKGLARPDGSLDCKRLARYANASK